MTGRYEGHGLIRDITIGKATELVESKLPLVRAVQTTNDEARLCGKHMEEAVDLIETIENLSLKLRQVVSKYYLALMSIHSPYMDRAHMPAGKIPANKQPLIRENITVNIVGNLVEITMFPLIKSLTAKAKKYVYYCVSEAINDYKTHAAPVRIGYPAVLVICTKRQRWDRIYDADNVEVSAVINAITPHFLPDDGPKYLSVYRMGMEAATASTEIFLMPLEEFPAWLNRFQIAARNDRGKAVLGR